MTDPIAVDLPAKPAFSRSVPPTSVTPAPLTAVPKPDVTAKPTPATTPVPLAEEVKQTVTPLPIGPTPAPTPATGFLSRFTKKQLTIGASAIVSLVAGIGGVRVLFPSDEEGPALSVVTQKTADATAIAAKKPAPTGAPIPPSRVEPVPGSNLKQFMPTNPDFPAAPSGNGNTLKPTGIQPAPGTLPPLPLIPSPDSVAPAIPAPGGLLPIGGTAPPLPVPPAPGMPAIPAVPPVGPATPPPLPTIPAPTGGMNPPTIIPDPKPPVGMGIPPIPAPTDVNPSVPLPPSFAPATPKQPDPLFPGVAPPAPTGVLPPAPTGVLPPAPTGVLPPAPTGVLPPAPTGVFPSAPSVFPVPTETKPEVKVPPPAKFDPPSGFGTPTTFTKPAGTPEVKPNVTEFAPKTDFDVDLYDPKATDTYESISREFYNDSKFAAALKAFNKNQQLQGGRFVEVPPIHILKRRFLTEAGGNFNPTPVITPTGGTGSVAPKSPSTAPEWGAAVPRPIPNNRGVFIVPQNGMTIAQIARQTLGTDQRWREIYDLNPQFTKPSELLPAGTEVRLPADARLP